MHLVKDFECLKAILRKNRNKVVTFQHRTADASDHLFVVKREFSTGTEIENYSASIAFYMMHYNFKRKTLGTTPAEHS